MKRSMIYEYFSEWLLYRDKKIYILFICLFPRSVRLPARNIYAAQSFRRYFSFRHGFLDSADPRTFRHFQFCTRIPIGIYWNTVR